MQCLPTSVQIHRSLSVRRLYLENETRQTHSHYGTPLGSWRTADSVAAFRSSPDGCLDDRLFSGKHDLAVTPCLRDIDSPLESDTTKDHNERSVWSDEAFGPAFYCTGDILYILQFPYFIQ